MTTKYKRTLHVIVSDKHGGHRLGLLNPETKLRQEREDGSLEVYYPDLTASQEYLWNNVYTKELKEIKKFAGEDDIIFFDLGDITQGIKYPGELAQTRLANQFLIAVANYAPVFSILQPKMVRINFGTPSHSMGEGSSELVVAEWLKERHPEVNIESLSHGLLDSGGLSIDYAHHGPHPGSRSWLRGNVARYSLRDILFTCLETGSTIPDIVLRGHFHTFVREALDFMGLIHWLVIAPSMCMLGDFGVQATRSSFIITNGFVVIESINGRPTEPLLFGSTLDIRTKEEYNGTG